MCREIQKSKRMRKTRDPFKKIGDIKGTFHTRMDMIKDRNGKDLTEAEEIEKRWQEYTELYKKVLQDLEGLTHLEPDILECEVKWPLGRITTNKASGVNGISSPSLRLLVVLLSKAHLISHSKMSSSRLVTTPSQLFE